MSKTITITLVKPLIIESVKNETFFRGNVEKAADQKAITVAYHEQAGDDTYQERLIERALYAALEDLKTHLSDYVSASGFSSADNSIGSSDEGTNIILHLTVGDRFNNGYTQSLARLCAKYIEECILMDWWKPINEKQSALYGQFVERDLAAVKRCFNKTAPVAPSVPYTKYLNVAGSAVELEVGEETTVTYEISDGAVDDIECRVADKTLIEAERSECGFVVKAKRRGHTLMQLYSRHNEELNTKIHVYVTDHT